MSFLNVFGVTLFWLMVGHAVSDFALQNDFMARGKNRNTEIGKEFWPYALSAHCLIHAGFVAYVTGSVPLGLFEFIAHGLVDFSKCEGKLSMKQDQAFHIGCKVFYAFMVALFVQLTTGSV